MPNQNMQPLPHYFASLEAFETQLEQVAGIKEMMKPLRPFLLNYGELRKVKVKHVLLRYVDFMAVSLEQKSRVELLELGGGLFALLNYYVCCVYDGAKNNPVLTPAEKIIFAGFGSICHNISQNISMDAHQICDARSFDTYIDFRFEYEDQTGAASTAIISNAFDPLFKILELLKYIQSQKILNGALMDSDLLPEGKYRYSSRLITFLANLPSFDQFQIWLNLHGSSAQASGISNDELMESYTLSLFPSDLDNSSRQFAFKDMIQDLGLQGLCCTNMFLKDAAAIAERQIYLDLTLHAQHPNSADPELSENFFLKMDNDEEQLLKLSDACKAIKLLLNDEKGNLYKLIKNKKNKFAEAELSQLYEKFNYFLAVVSKLNEECDLGYSPNEEYIERKIAAKHQHLSSCFEEYKYSQDSNPLCRLKAFFSGGMNLHIGIYVLNNDMAFTCSKIQHEISMIIEAGWDAPRCHKYDYHSTNKKLLIYRINKLTALIKLQNMVYNNSGYSIDENEIKQIKSKIA